MSDRCVHRWQVPADDRWHALLLSGPIVHVATRSSDVVEIWTIKGDGEAVNRRLRVFGTGQPLPDGVTHVGSVVTAGGRLVWHLFEQVADHA